MKKQCKNMHKMFYFISIVVLSFFVSFTVLSRALTPIEKNESLPAPALKEPSIASLNPPSPAELLVSPKVAAYYPLSNFYSDSYLSDGGRSPLEDLRLPCYRQTNIYSYEHYVFTKFMNIRFFDEPALCILKINFSPDRQTSDAWQKLYSEFRNLKPYQTWKAIKWRILETIQEEEKPQIFTGDVQKLIDDVRNVFCVPTIPTVDLSPRTDSKLSTKNSSFEFTRSQRYCILNIFENLCKNSRPTLEERTYFTEVRDISAEYKPDKRVSMLGFIWKVLIGSDFIVFYSDGVFYDLLWPNRAEKDLDIAYPENYRSGQRVVPSRWRKTAVPAKNDHRGQGE
ncbi:MAG: hypothetical protein LBP21_09260 [Synergistaceae bacterium]|jgi:hypothetical protein|nr:hypothetical protein [Synergistaceae bacterium]